MREKLAYFYDDLGKAMREYGDGGLPSAMALVGSFASDEETFIPLVVKGKGPSGAFVAFRSVDEGNRVIEAEDLEGECLMVDTDRILGVAAVQKVGLRWMEEPTPLFNKYEGGA